MSAHSPGEHGNATLPPVGAMPDLAAYIQGAYANAEPVDDANDASTAPMPLPHYVPHSEATHGLGEEELRARKEEVKNDTTIDHEGLSGRGWVREAPTLQAITRDPRSANRYKRQMFAERSTGFYGATAPESNSLSEIYTVEHPEIEAAYDLVHKMLQVEKVLGEEIANGASNTAELEHAIAQSRDLRENLRIIGEEDLIEACGGIAASWLEKLDSSDKDLFVGMFYDDSSAYIYGLVANQLQQLVAERGGEDVWTGRIHPVDIDAQPTKDQQEAVQNGIFVAIDDWTVSGRQMESLVNEVQYWYELSPADIEINLVCATSDQLVEGIDNAKVVAYFKRPQPQNSTEDAGITGLQHSSTDFGFRNIINQCYRRLRQVEGYQNYPYPILYNVARPYRMPMHDQSIDYTIQGVSSLESARRSHADRVRNLQARTKRAA